MIKNISALFQASATVYMRPALFWGITGRRVVVIDVSGQPICLVLDCLTLEDGTYRSSRNVGN
jgi:hypothetical protein